MPTENIIYEKRYPERPTKDDYITVKTFVFVREDCALLGISIRSTSDSFNAGRFASHLSGRGYFPRGALDRLAFKAGDVIRCGGGMDMQFDADSKSIIFRETTSGSRYRIEHSIQILGGAGSVVRLAYFSPSVVALVDRALDELHSINLQALLHQEAVAAVPAPVVEGVPPIVPAVEAASPDTVLEPELLRMLTAVVHTRAVAQTPRTPAPAPMESHTGTPTQHHTFSAHPSASESSGFAADMMMEVRKILAASLSHPASLASSVRNSQCTTPTPLSTESP